jgi:hypothetical protein
MWPSDGYADDNAAAAAPLAFGTWQIRNFDLPTDVDHARTATIVAGQRARIAVSGYTPRAHPSMRVQICNGALGCGGWQAVASPYELAVNVTTTITVEVTNADRLAGLDTDYQIRADLVAPALVSPSVGPWYNPDRSGNGVDLQSAGGDQYVGVWYTYRPDGSPTWYISDVAPLYGRQWKSPLFESTWDGTRKRLRAVGAITFDWSGSTGATMRWSLDGRGAGTEPFQWFLFGGATGIANGLWYPPAQSGWGASMWHQANTMVLTTYTYDAVGRATWAQGVATGSPSGITFANLYQIHGGDSLCPGCTGSTPRTTHEHIGTATFALTGAAQAQFSVNQTYAVAPGGWAQTVDFARLTQ